MNDNKKNPDSEDNPFDDSMGLFDDLLGPSGSGEKPASDSSPAKKSPQKAPPQKPLNKKKIPPVPPKKAQAPVKKDPPLTKKEVPPKGPVQKTPRIVTQKIVQDKKPRKTLNTLIFALSIVVLVILSMFTGRIIDFNGILNRGDSLKSDIKPVSNPDITENTVTDVKETKTPSPKEDAAKPAEQVPEPQVTDTAGKNEETNAKASAIISDKSPGKTSSAVKARVLSFPYSVYLGSYSDMAKVEKASSDYRESGLLPYWVKLDLGEKGIWYRLFAGYFQNRAEADELIKTKNLNGAESKLTKYANLVGSYTSEEEINRLKKDLEEKGYSPYVINDAENTYRLYIGAYYQKSRAKEQNSDLELEGVQSELVER